MNYAFEHSRDRLGKGAVFSRVLPVLGHIAKGAAKKESSKAPGKDIDDGFRVSLRLKPEFIQPILQKYFDIVKLDRDYIKGGIPISLPFEDVYDNLWVGNREVTSTKGQIGHDCQNIPVSMRGVLRNIPDNAIGIILYRVTFDNTGKKRTDTLYAPPEKTRIEFCDGKTCKPIILFRFHVRVGGLENYGVFGLSTSSIYDVNKIPQQLLYYDTLLRQYGFPTGIRHVPLILERLEEHVTTTAPKVGTFKADKWLLNIRLDNEFLKLCPIFSTPPLHAIPHQTPIRRANIDKELERRLDALVSGYAFSPDVVVFVKGVLETGVYEKKGAIYPVTNVWVEDVLMPRLEKIIGSSRVDLQASVDKKSTPPEYRKDSAESAAADVDDTDGQEISNDTEQEEVDDGYDESEVNGDGTNLQDVDDSSEDVESEEINDQEGDPSQEFKEHTEDTKPGDDSK